MRTSQDLLECWKVLHCCIVSVKPLTKRQVVLVQLNALQQEFDTHFIDVRVSHGICKQTSG